MRTLIDLPEPQIRRLDIRARSAKRSRASLIREAVDQFLGPDEVLSVDQIFGLWGDHAIDGVDYQRRIRAEWNRDWDPD